MLALRVKKLLLAHWEYILPNVLYVTRLLSCTGTNCTPHECMFCIERK